MAPEKGPLKENPSYYMGGLSAQCGSKDVQGLPQLGYS